MNIKQILKKNEENAFKYKCLIKELQELIKTKSINMSGYEYVPTEEIKKILEEYTWQIYQKQSKRRIKNTNS